MMPGVFLQPPRQHGPCQSKSGPEKEDDGRPEIRQGQNGDIFGPIALR